MRGIKPTEEIIKEKCKQLNLNYIDTYKTKHDTRIRAICPKHEDKGILDMTWSHLKNATYGCKYCSGKNRTLDDFKKLIDFTKIDFLSDYIGFEKNIKCKCKECGYEFETMPKTLIQGKYYCPRCSIIYKGLSKRLSHDEFVNKLANINPDISLISNYETSKSKIKCKCKKCNHEWDSIAYNLIYEHIQCPACSSSKSENKLADLLSSLNLNYKRKIRFEECKYKNPLEFDFIIYSDNTFSKIVFACEYDGEQHFYPIPYSSNSDGKHEFELTQKRDNIKNEYCKNINIPIIRIPYWKRDNMECFLIKKIKENNLEYVLTETLETAG